MESIMPVNISVDDDTYTAKCGLPLQINTRGIGCCHRQDTGPRNPLWRSAVCCIQTFGCSDQTDTVPFRFCLGCAIAPVALLADSTCTRPGAARSFEGHFTLWMAGYAILTGRVLKGGVVRGSRIGLNVGLFEVRLLSHCVMAHYERRYTRAIME